MCLFVCCCCCRHWYCCQKVPIWDGCGLVWEGEHLKIAILDPSPLLCWMLIPKGKYLSAFFNVEKRVKADDIRWHQMMRYYLFNVHGHCALCVQRGDCDNKWGSFDQLEKQSENAIVMRIIKERKQKLEKEKNNDDTNEYRHKERGGLRAINILADCPLTPTARNITHIWLGVW